MNSKKKVLSVLVTAVMVAILLGCVYCIAARPAEDKIFCAAGVIALAVLIPYVFSGFTKKFSVWYRIFMALFAFMAMYSGLINLLNTEIQAFDINPMITAFVYFFLFPHYLLFGIAENLQKVITYSFCAIDLVLITVATVVTSNDITYLARNLISAGFIILTFLLISVKYIDKKERGTK